MLRAALARIRKLLLGEPSASESASAYPTAGGGLIVARGEGPRRMFEYEPLKLQTAEDYLRAREPSPARVLLVGEEEYDKEIAAYEEEHVRWLREASEFDLNRLPECALLESKRKADDFISHKLLEAYEHRGFPRFEALEAYAAETNDDSLHELLAEMRAEGL